MFKITLWGLETLKHGAMSREKIAILPKLYDFGGSMDIQHKWYVYFSIKDPRTGKMVRKKFYNGLSKIKDRQKRYQEAENIIRHYTDKLKSGWNPFINNDQAIYTDQLQYKFAARIYTEKKSANRTINFYINEYIKESFSGLDPNTISTYTSKFRVFQMWLNREKYTETDITTYTITDIQKFFRYLNEERKSSAITFRKYKQLIFGLFEYLLDKELIFMNPVQKLPKCTRVTDKTPKPISNEDVQVFIKHLKKLPQVYLFLLFEYYCLMRPNEIRLMKVSWIDFGRKIIRIPSEISKSRRPKTPIIPDVFMKILRDEYNLHLIDKTFYVIGKEGIPGLMHLGKNTMRYRFNRIRDELKMPFDYMLYSWKHTANVRLEENHVPIYDRMMQNGHTSIVTTETYTKNKTGFRSNYIASQYPNIEIKNPLKAN